MAKVSGADIGIDLGTANVLVYVSGKGIVLEEPSVVAIDNKTNEILAVGKEAKRMIIGIDLGTANVLVYVSGKGIVLEEPSVVAIDNKTNEILAVGKEAKRMIGRTPANISAIRPLRDGVISDYNTTEKMLKYFVEKIVEKKGFGKIVMPRIMVCVPTGVTEVEKRAVEDATKQAGAREVYVIEEPIAAAIGAGIEIGEPSGNMIIDIGGGTVDIAVISLGGAVVSDSIKMGS